MRVILGENLNDSKIIAPKMVGQDEFHLYDNKIPSYLKRSLDRVLLILKEKGVSKMFFNEHNILFSNTGKSSKVRITDFEDSTQKEIRKTAKSLFPLI